MNVKLLCGCEIATTDVLNLRVRSACGVDWKIVYKEVMNDSALVSVDFETARKGGCWNLPVKNILRLPRDREPCLAHNAAEYSIELVVSGPMLLPWRQHQAMILLYLLAREVFPVRSIKWDVVAYGCITRLGRVRYVWTDSRKTRSVWMHRTSGR